jgi:hypothetical protein
VNCNPFILNITGQQAYWFIGKFCMRFSASCALVIVKWSANVRTSMYIMQKVRRKVRNYPHFCFSNLFTQK